MSELISGEEALIALANGEDVLWRTKADAEIKCFKRQTPNLESVLSGNSDYRFWIKPRTIIINGIEVPSPFKPKDGDSFWHIYPSHSTGYHAEVMQGTKHDELYSQFGAWRTEEEIKQVVAALRSIFK